jgi:hypothetical protein
VVILFLTAAQLTEHRAQGLPKPDLIANYQEGLNNKASFFPSDLDSGVESFHVTKIQNLPERMR